jgi:oligopeptide/dipeptide ABC transporter ATP-binding protein
MPDPADRLKKYPHELSGGQSQRVMIAMMLAGNPQLLIADEPTTALDVTIQAQILRLLNRLRDERNMAIILVTHDLGVVAQTCDRMAVMYCGRIVETGSVKEVFSLPGHPYTFGLLKSRPRIDRKMDELIPIKGVVPMPTELPPGCTFEPRCPNGTAQCRQRIPELRAECESRFFACFNPMVSVDRETNQCQATQ